MDDEYRPEDQGRENPLTQIERIEALELTAANHNAVLQLASISINDLTERVQMLESKVASMEQRS